MFIGEYNKAVVLTYLSVVFGILGFSFAFSGNFMYAMICLLIAGVCDTFDGKVARSCERTEDGKRFGIEIDSLADTINFVVLPIAIFFNMGMTSWYHIIIYTLYALAGIIRLAYFNVLAFKEQDFKPVDYYTGLPVTTVSFFFPFVYAFSKIIPMNIMQWIFTGMTLLIAFLFVFNFKLKKPKGKTIYAFLVIAIIMAAAILFLAK